LTRIATAVRGVALALVEHGADRAPSAPGASARHQRDLPPGHREAGQRRVARQRGGERERRGPRRARVVTRPSPSTSSDRHTMDVDGYAGLPVEGEVAGTTTPGITRRFF
jgi:hypothetical protein